MLRMVTKYSPRTRHNPTEVRQIRGYPDSLKLFRMPASKYWYVRMYIKGGPSSGVKKSTRCLHLSDAEDFAKNWYEERLLERRNNKFIEEQSFEAFSQRFQTTQKRQISRGELVAEMHYNDKLKLDNDLLPYLGHLHVSKIDYNTIDNFIAEIYGEKGLSQSSLKKYVILVRKVLKEAERDGTIDHIPSLPNIKRVENPRPWFSPEQYTKLLKACRDLRDNPHTVNITGEKNVDPCSGRVEQDGTLSRSTCFGKNDLSYIVPKIEVDGSVDTINLDVTMDQNDDYSEIETSVTFDEFEKNSRS
jgi:hypothetical protein